MNYFDCHADTLTRIPLSETLWENTCDLDLKRIRRFAHNYTQIFAVWADQADIAGEYPEEAFEQLYRRAVLLLQAQAEHITWCRNAADMQEAHKAGKAAAFLSIEDVSLMGSSVERIREMGFRFAMLTWNYENRYACGAVAGQSKGLTADGRSLAQYLLDQRVVLDISHLSDQGIEDIFQMTERPVMASHSNVREICSHPRNLQKAHIQELARRRGLLGLNFYAPFIREQIGEQNRERPRMTDLIRHIDAVLEAGGAEILAIGSDFDGCGEQFPEGMTDVQAVLRFRQMLEQEGFGADIIENIFFGNAQRFLTQNVV